MMNQTLELQLHQRYQELRREADDVRRARQAQIGRTTANYPMLLRALARMISLFL